MAGLRFEVVRKSRRSKYQVSDISNKNQFFSFFFIPFLRKWNWTRKAYLKLILLLENNKEKHFHLSLISTTYNQEKQPIKCNVITGKYRILHKIFYHFMERDKNVHIIAHVLAWEIPICHHKKDINTLAKKKLSESRRLRTMGEAYDLTYFLSWVNQFTESASPNEAKAALKSPRPAYHIHCPWRI